MYRPPLIGPYPLLDLDRAALAWPTAWNTAGNFNAVDTLTAAAKAPHFWSATVQEQYDFVAWVADVAMTLADGNAMSFGVCVSGTHEAGKPMVYSGHVALSFDSPCQVDVWCARLTGSTVDVTRTAANNAVDSPLQLQHQVIYYANHTTGGWQGSFVSMDQEDDGFDTDPVVLGCTLLNDTGGVATIENLSVTMSLHRYAEDIQSFEPAR